MRLRSPTVLSCPAFFSRAAGRSSSLALTPSLPRRQHRHRLARRGLHRREQTLGECIDLVRRAALSRRCTPRGRGLRLRLSTPWRGGTRLRQCPSECLAELRLVGGKLLLDQGLHRGLERGDVDRCHAS